MKTLLLIAALAFCGCAHKCDLSVWTVGEVKTNMVPGYFASPEAKVGTNGWLETFSHAIAIPHPPRTEIVTNWTLIIQTGTNRFHIPGFNTR